LAKHRWIFIPALGSAFFWGVGALSQTNIDLYSQRILQISQVDAMYLIAILSAGIALGSVLAGLISRKRIELGLVPIGAFGIVVCGFLLAFTPEFKTSQGAYYEIARAYVDATHVIDPSDLTTLIVDYDVEVPEDFINSYRGAPMTTFGFIYGAICLFLLGTFAGMYDIPMISYIQQQSPPELRGRILAATNFFSFSAMLLFAGGVFLLLSSGFGLNANQIWCVMSCMILVVAGLLTIHFAGQLKEFVHRIFQRNR
jgi:acyl-[acyl-carrier-protein]-phospholipid O-acyltransferase/long-chain-fatty-acid--[acyl-carrier-protein] ligase